MPDGIALRRIANLQAATRPIASKPANKRVRTPVVEVYAASTTFTAPHTGRFTFALRGPGGLASAGPNGGASGALAIITKYQRRADTVALVIGANTTSTTATFSDGTVVTAGAGVTTTPGTATGGDINLSGVANSGVNGGAAPTSGSYRGGPGGTSTNEPGPGAGAYGSAQWGGAGTILVHSAD